MPFPRITPIRRTIPKMVLATLCLLSIGIGEIPMAQAAPPATVDLGTAGQFGVLAGSAVTNTGATTINGDLGLSPGSSVTGFPPGVVNGVKHVTDAVAATAQADLTTAYNSAAGRDSDANLSGQDLGGKTLTTGVYTYDVAAQLTGTVTLNAEGNPSAVFIFQIGSSLTTASASAVALINGAQACNVFWQVGESVTLGTNTDFVGTILALTSITANTGTTVDGRLLARNGAVTLDATVVNRPTCADAPTPGVTVTKTAVPSSRPAPGGVFTYTVDVQNTGTAEATLTSLNDSVYGDLNGQGTCATGGAPILAGATYTCSFQGTFNGFDGDSETDVVLAVLNASGVRSAGQDDETVTLTSSPTGILEICKRRDDSNGIVTGNFDFTFLGRTVTVPVGNCTGPMRVPAGDITVTEATKPTTQVTTCGARPSTRLVSCDPANSTAVISVPPASGVSNESVLFVTNRLSGPTTTPTTVKPHEPGTSSIKVCKIAGNGVALGTRFGFAVGNKNVTVPAGPASQGGYCKLVSGFTIGDDVAVTERAIRGVRVTSIGVQPPQRRVSSSKAKRTVSVTVGRGFTVVSFTNAR